VLDYDCEYDAGYDVVKFPEYKNKVTLIPSIYNDRFGNSSIVTLP